MEKNPSTSEKIKEIPFERFRIWKQFTNFASGQKQKKCFCKNRKRERERERERRDETLPIRRDCGAQ